MQKDPKQFTNLADVPELETAVKGLDAKLEQKLASWSARN